MATCASPTDGAPRRLPRLDDRLALGGSGLLVSPACVGTTDADDVVPAAFDAGVNFFFLTADLHWPRYEHTRRGLAALLRRPGLRERIVVGVVSYLGPQLFRHLQFGEVLDAVPGLERVDLLIAGAATDEDCVPRLACLRAAREQALFGARAIGASFHSREAARAALSERGALDIAFVRYNPGHRGARHELLPFVPPRPRALLFNFKTTMFHAPVPSPAPGPWQPRLTDHYRYVLTPSEMDGVLTAFASAAEIAGLQAALEEGPLLDWQQARLEQEAGARIRAWRAADLQPVQGSTR